MYDFNGIRIFFKHDHTNSSIQSGELISHVDLRECALKGLHIVPRSMTYHEDGNDEYHDLMHPWASLPSSFTGIAFKIFQSGYHNNMPYVELKASPAKITQGHNVFGSEDLEQGIREIYRSFHFAFPQFAKMLDFDSAEFFRIDATYSIKMPNRETLASVLDSLSRVSNRYLRPSRDGMYESTIYFNNVRNNSNTGRTASLCIYSKLDEIQSQLEELKKKAKKGQPVNKKIKLAEKVKKKLKTRLANGQFDSIEEGFRKSSLNESLEETFVPEQQFEFKQVPTIYDSVIEALSSPELQYFATDRLRFEARVCTRFFDKHKLPRNVNQLITYAKGYESEHGKGAFCRFLWREAMKDLLDAIDGQKITVIHDSKVKKLLHAAFDTINAKGKLRSAKARRLFSFYSRLTHEGHNSGVFQDSWHSLLKL